MNHEITECIAEIQKSYQIVKRRDDAPGLINTDGKNKKFSPIQSRDGIKTLKKIAKKCGFRFSKHDFESLVTELEIESEDTVPIATSLRVYREGNVVEIDIGDTAGTVARVTQDGVELITTGAGAVFEKSALMKALPIPDQAGNYELLLPYFNVDETSKLLLIAWVTYTLAHPKVPSTNFVLLFLIGGQGSGKSFLTRILANLIDPSAIGTQIFPRRQSDLIAFAGHRHMIAFDNLRELTPLWSDLLCVCCTGGAATSRKLYTDGDIHDSYVHIAMILNGIHNPINQSDLAQRALMIETHTIDGGNRLSEQELLEKFENEQEQIFGGLLNLMSKILSHLPDTEVTKPERMIEFCQWLAAMEEATEIEAGDLQSAYSASINASQIDTLLENPFAACVVEFAKSLPSKWVGTPTELLRKLEFEAPHNATRSSDWPKTAISLSKRLNSLRASLLSYDIEIKLWRGKERRIEIINLESF